MSKILRLNESPPYTHHYITLQTGTNCTLVMERVLEIIQSSPRILDFSNEWYIGGKKEGKFVLSLTRDICFHHYLIRQSTMVTTMTKNSLRI
jgi:hypothetical protein